MISDAFLFPLAHKTPQVLGNEIHPAQAVVAAVAPSLFSFKPDTYQKCLSEALLQLVMTGCTCPLQNTQIVRCQRTRQ
jgi:hypothetical protein